MATDRLSAVFEILEELKCSKIIDDYALGGAMAVLFYAEPTRTYDLDVFVLLHEAPGLLVSLSPLYRWLEERGFATDAEHVLIHGVPVQFLAAPNALAVEAVREARLLDYESRAVRVIGPEHLIALFLQAGGGKRRERSFLLLESGATDRQRLRDILERFSIPSRGLLDA